MPLSKAQLFVIATASIVYFYQGYVHAIFNGLVTMDSFIHRFPETNMLIGNETQRNTASLLQGTVVAILDIGSAIGSLLCSWLGDKLGRKKLVYATVVIAMLGVILQLTSYSYVQLIAGRILGGVGLGAFSATVPMWLSECLEPSNRGKITLFTGTFVIFGFVVAAIIDLGFFYVEKYQISWRLPLSLQIIPLLLILTFSFGACESPRWLVKQDSIHEAITVLSQLKGLSEDEDSVHEEINAIQNNTLKENKGTAGSVNTIYRAFLAIYLCVLVTMSGINVISFFSTEMFENQLSFTPENARILSLSLQLIQLSSAFLACFLVETLGRRVTMMISAGTLAVTMGCMGGLGQFNTRACQIATVAFQFITMIGYPIGFHSTPYMYCAEIAPLLNRHLITSTSSAAHWLFNFIVAEITPAAFTNIKSSYYFIYMCVNACTLASLYFLYPETKGLQLESIDNIFMISENPLQVVNTARKLAASKDMRMSITSTEINYSSSYKQQILDSFSVEIAEA